MNGTKEFGLHDFPEHRDNLEEQMVNLGMEACKTHEQRAEYVRRLVRGIFQSDLPGIGVVRKTKLVFGKESFTPIPEFEHMLATWNDFPNDELAKIIEEERSIVDKSV